MATPPPPEQDSSTPAPAAARGGMRALRGLGWLGHWLPGAALGLALAGVVAGWVWTGREGSLASALGWAQAGLQDAGSPAGRLQTSGVQGSVRGGGRVQQLRWSAQGLEVELQGLELRWSGAQLIDALLGRGLRISGLHIARLQVDDRREPKPAAPLQRLELPLPLEVDWSVDAMELTGRQALSLRGARGHYRYGAIDAADRQAWGDAAPAVHEAHHLRLDTLELAQGRYRLEAVLGAQAPMPLHAALLGTVQTRVPGGQALDLQATASARGTLAGPGASLELQAQLQPTAQTGTPTLVAQARILPWATQPLHHLDAQAHRLDLSTLWPQAPQTTLSGAAQARPDGSAWRARLSLRNEGSGPWDRQRLPLDALQADIEQREATWQIHELHASLAHARAQGQGSFRPAGQGQAAQWQGQLQIEGLDPAQVWSALAAGALDLKASARPVTGSLPATAIDLQAQNRAGLASGKGWPLRGLQLLGQWRGEPAGNGVLQIDQAQLDAVQAQLSAQGTLDLGRRRFNGHSTLQLPGLQGRLQGTLAARDGAGDLTLDVDRTDALLAWMRGLQDLPLAGPPLRDALAHQPLLRDGAFDGRLHLQTRWQGGLGPLGFPDAGGTGAPAVPLQVQLTLDVPQWRSSLPGGTGSFDLRDLRLQADGGLADLALRLQGQATQGPWVGELQANARLQGAWPWPQGSGEPARLQVQALNLKLGDRSRHDRVLDWALRSTAPFVLAGRTLPDGPSLQVGPAQWQLQAQLRRADQQGTTDALTPVSLAWDRLDLQGGTWQTRGRLSGLPLSWVDALARADGASNGPLALAGVGGDLVFDGDWDLLLPTHGDAPPRLNAHLQRRSGDLNLLADTLEPGSSGRRLQGGVREASLRLDTQDRQVSARLRWDSERLGQISADVDSELSGGPGATGALLDRWWPAQAPLRGSVSARLPQLGVWSALAPPGWRMRGTLQADATLEGTRGAPDWRGTLQADELALRSVVDGFEFTQGVLRANLSGEHIAIDRFELKSPLGGSLSATGQARWQVQDGRRQPQIDLQVTAQKLRVSNRADRRLTLSGQVGARLNGPQLNIRGQLTADAALFVLPDEATPTLGSDVVVRGGRNLAQGTSTVAQVQPDVSVDLNLGPQFEVRGRGLQARLTGQLNLRATPALPAPRVYGEVRTASGSYRAYGQQLSISNGALIFNGPYDDPSLDILAIRPQSGNTEQQVGVQINGSAQAPRVRLVATPDLPDAEKLAWLVLGRPATGAGAEAAVLQQAALALLAGQDGGLNGGLARALGLDEISYRGESLNTDGSTRAAAVTLGKRISSQLYLSYETGLAGAMGTVSVFYDLSRRFTLRARAGQENAVDLIFTLQYD